MSSGALTIRPVYAENLDGEFALINEIVDDYCYIAMDAKFPGVPIGPAGTFESPADHRYQTLRINVSNLHLIQLNLTFSDTAGNLPASPTGGGRISAWQFNFREFDADAHIADPDAVETLRAYGGVDFVRNREEGIDARRFGELLMSSGAVLNDSVEWVTFDGGYDIGYLLKMLTGRGLPETQEGFYELVSTFFPTVYDVKHLMASRDELHGGLNEVAELLGVEQVGVCRQVGSESLLTDRVFREMKERYFDGSVERYGGSLYGLGLTNSGNI